MEASKPEPMRTIRWGLCRKGMQQVMQFGRNINGNPQMVVQNLLRSGQMSQQQFQQYAQTANQILGRRA